MSVLWTQMNDTKEKIKSLEESIKKLTDSKKDLTDKKASIETQNNNIWSLITSKQEEY